MLIIITCTADLNKLRKVVKNDVDNAKKKYLILLT